MPELTEADMAGYRITFYLGGPVSPTYGPVTVRAAYVSTDEQEHPGMLVLKDWEHRAVALANLDMVLMVERLEPDQAAGREILEGRPWKM